MIYYLIIIINKEYYNFHQLDNKFIDHTAKWIVRINK